MENTKPVQTKQLGLGSIVVLDRDDDCAVRWAVLAVHPQDSALLFAVPGDGHPLFGLPDCPLPKAPTGGMTLRCGWGLWLPRAFVESLTVIGTLSSAELNYAKAKMNQVVTGRLDAPEAASENEADPEYRDWMMEVGTAVEALAERFRGG